MNTKIGEPMKNDKSNRPDKTTQRDPEANRPNRHTQIMRRIEAQFLLRFPMPGNARKYKRRCEKRKSESTRSKLYEIHIGEESAKWNKNKRHMAKCAAYCGKGENANYYMKPKRYKSSWKQQHAAHMELHSKSKNARKPKGRNKNSRKQIIPWPKIKRN